MNNIGCGVIGFIMVLFVVGGFIFHNSTKDEITVTVEDKWIKAAPNSEGQQSYMLATTGGVLTVSDNLFALQFRSSDIYARARVGETYCFKVSGFRFGLTSSYQNVYGFCEVVR